MSSPDLDVRQGQLGRFLEHIEHLKKLDISGVEPTAHTYPIFNVTREDVPRASMSREAALRLAPRAANSLVIVPKVVE